MVDWLIVLRNELIPEFFVAMAELEGKTAQVCEVPEEAFEWIEEIEKQDGESSIPTIAFINVYFRLSDIRGTEVAKRLRASSILHNIAIIFFDTPDYSFAEWGEIMAETDADLYFSRHIPKYKDLMSIFEDLVRKRQSLS